MSIELHTITFNHDTGSASNSSLNIRQNDQVEIAIPEFDCDIPRDMELSCAAYSISNIINKELLIRVAFRIPQPIDITYEVKATGGGILGDLDPIKVEFKDGYAEKVTDIHLSNISFSEIGVHDITWKWYYRARPRILGPVQRYDRRFFSGLLNILRIFPFWKKFATSQHRIFTILSTPIQPWSQTFGDRANPWTALLYESCTMASGTSNPIKTIRAITKQINRKFKLKYDIVSGAPNYLIWGTFNIQKWIDYVLKQNAPTNPKFCPGTSNEYKEYLIVNCYDCAAALSLMAKLVGAPTEYNFHNPFGYLNYVVPIGRGRCNNPFYGCQGDNPAVGEDDYRSGFGNHAYTKKSSENIFDATMRAYVDCGTRISLLLVAAIILLVTLGTADVSSLIDRADGLLVNLGQDNYESIVIDVSEPFEAAAATGSPSPVSISF